MNGWRINRSTKQFVCPLVKAKVKGTITDGYMSASLDESTLTTYEDLICNHATLVQFICPLLVNRKSTEDCIPTSLDKSPRCINADASYIRIEDALAKFISSSPFKEKISFVTISIEGYMSTSLDKSSPIMIRKAICI